MFHDGTPDTAFIRRAGRVLSRRSQQPDHATEPMLISDTASRRAVRYQPRYVVTSRLADS